MKSTVYCRVSTEDQEREGTSLDSQKEACLKKAQELGYEVPSDYVFLETWSGADTDRPKLNELRKLVRECLVGCMVCYSTDRLARNPIHIAIIAEECEKRGIELVFVTEPLDNSPEGALIRYVKGYAAQMEREKIRERSLRGKMQKAREGKLATGGPPLFGYALVDGRRVINPVAAELIRQIFRWFAEDGYTLYRATAELNANSISAPRGGKWCENAVYRLITNLAYQGVTYAFRYKAVEPKNPKLSLRRYSKTRHILRDEAEWIPIPGATPAIVDASIWEKAQETLHRNRQKSRRSRKHQYLFTSGRLRCGTCGHSMVGNSTRKTNGYRLFYRCICNVKPNYYQQCPQHCIAANKVEPLAWAEVSRVLKNPFLILEELERQRRENTPIAIETEEILIENNIANALKEEQRYLRLYGQGRVDEGLLFAETDRISRGKKTLQDKLVKLKEQRKAIEEAHNQYDRVNEVIAQVAEKVDTADYELKQLALEALDVRVILHLDGTIQINGSIPVELSTANL